MLASLESPHEVLGTQSRYSGHLEVRKPGEHTFETVSSSASFVLVVVEVAFHFHGDTAGRQFTQVHWDFGDGQHAVRERVEHVYLEGGVYQVSVKATLRDGETLTGTRRVVARLESLQREDLNARLESYYRKTRGHDLQALTPSQLRQLIWLRRKGYRWESDLWTAVEAWYRRRLPLKDGQIAGLGLRRATSLVSAGSEEAMARGILGDLATGAATDRLRAEARTWPACHLSVRVAEATLRKDYEERRDDDTGYRGGLFLARAYPLRGRTAGARTILEDLETAAPSRRSASSGELTASVRRVSFDNLLRQKKLSEAQAELERWEWELPLGLLSGHLQLARARLYQASDRHAETLRELQSLEALPAARRQLPRALLFEAEILRSSKRLEEARERLERLVEEFPERPESKEAAACLAKL